MKSSVDLNVILLKESVLYLKISYPSGVRLVQLVKHDNRCAAVVEHKPPEVSGGARQRVRGHYEGCGAVKAISKCSINVVVALSFSGDEERQGTIWRKNVHTAVLLTVPRQQCDATLFNVQVRCHRV